MSEEMSIPLAVRSWPRILNSALFLGLFSWISQTLKMMPGDYRIAAMVFWVVTLVLALVCIVSVLARVVLHEQGVTVIILGLPIKRYPREKLKLMCCVWDRQWNQVCLCTVSEERLAKRKPLKSTYRGYSHRYVGAEAVQMILMGKSRWAQLFPITGEALWIEWRSGLTEELKRLYPDVPWLDGITAG